MFNVFVDLVVVCEMFQEVFDVFNQDFGKLIVEGLVEELNLIINMQFVMLIVVYVCYCVWQQVGGLVLVIVVGYSFGEYMVFVVVGVFVFKDVVLFVCFCVQVMQMVVLVGQGGMVVILGFDDDMVCVVCVEVVEVGVVEVVNFNVLVQVVIVGSKVVVEKVCEIVKVKGVKCVLLLLVLVLFYLLLFKLVLDQLCDYFVNVDVKVLQILVVNNIDVVVVSDLVVIKDVLVCQVVGLVCWVECVWYIVGMGVMYVIECGLGKVLVGLMKCIDGNLMGVLVFDLVLFDEVIKFVIV